jgi:transmembrane sensor
MDFNRSVKERIVAYLQDELSKDEIEKLATWISMSEKNARFFARVKDIWEASLKDYSQYAETQKEWEKLRLKISPDLSKEIDKSRSFIRRFAKVAAILTIGIIAGSIVEKVIVNGNDNVPIISKAPSGSIAEVILPDSSVVFLNSGSELRYSASFRKKARKVFLEGEGMFKVKNAHNSPFVVHTGSYDVTVLGTEFNIRAYKNEKSVETTLQKGSVMISSSGNQDFTGKIILKPGEQLVYNKNERTSRVDTVNAMLFTSWKEDVLSFSKLSLQELFLLFERRYNVSIIVENKGILKYHYSGTINKDETIIELLDIIKETLPIEYHIDNQQVFIKQIEKRKEEKKKNANL